ncbi:adenylosuccinate synthase [Eisenibacter elegans]|jgi:adenylosuccinate synthase|uniref:adenylosuccinate synthase n=1 Tax=Eisenibacter elegans TaxID=997 RepID=UPI00041767D9|nr:adenylosuccinate synthase [Eisenibacter elegans]
MAVDILLGLQWGDEGKGKIVDFLAPQYQVVARFQGGPNAGHTLEFDGIKHVLHQVPSGIFRTEIQNIVGNGVVLDPVVFKKELDALVEKFGIDVRANLFISKKAHLILPTHKYLDAAQEQAKGASKIGSTLRGIGPTYQDKIGRQGLRVGDILSPDFEQRYQKLKTLHLQIIKNLAFDCQDLSAQEEAFWKGIEALRSLNLADTEYLLNDALQQGKTILAEGAQGTLLDVDFGSYPFVTSSNTTAMGAFAGLGLAPKHVGEVLGIFKAYCTRVGSGPFPTEQDNDTGAQIRAIGREFGATTGRERRCGWLDLPALKYAVMLNGVTQLYMMKADVLNSFEQIQVCTHYRLPDGSLTEQVPFDMLQTDVTPVYQTLEGWNCDLEAFRQFDQLPEALCQYIAFIEAAVGVPITLVSIGPDRTQTIKR